MTSNNSVIYVVPNYRLGSFGLLGQFGDINPGTMDQLFAMEWVQRYISLFGGDPNRVTVAGHSAGVSCLLSHLLSNGDEGTLPFNQAVVMSPAVSPITLDSVATRNLEVLEFFGLESYSQDQILALSATTINDFTGHIGSSGWGPIIDGSYYREMPGSAFAAGRYHTGLNIITGQPADEGHDFTPATSPYIIDGDSDIRNMTFDTKELMASFFEGLGFNLSYTVLDRFWEFYPAINNTSLYYNMFGKYDKILSEVLLDCYSLHLSQAYDTVYGWYFDESPSYHAQENPYLFAGGTGTGGIADNINGTLSFYMKSWLVNFVKGDINGNTGIPTWEAYSVSQQNIELGSDNVGIIDDPSNNEHCMYMQTKLS